MSVNNGTLNNNSVIAWNCNSIDGSKKKPDVDLKEANKTRTSSKRSCRDVCAIGSFLLFGFMFLTFGILTTKFTLFELVLKERLRMSTFHPSFFWWANPEPEVLLRAYIFNITNSEEFMAGIDKKLKLEEIGPITFQEILTHSNIVFNDENSTMSYNVSRRIVFKESENIKGILNQTLIVANNAVLSGCSYAVDSFVTRIGYQFVLGTHNSKPVVETTIYNYFFNLTDPTLDFLAKVVPWMVPTKNTGVLQNIYETDKSDHVNVKIGARNGNKNFFKIHTYNYRQTVPNNNPESGGCNASISGASEGAIYPQLCTNESVLWYWRKTLCRAVPLYFDSEVQIEGLKGYKFILRDDVYDRFENKTADCYKGSNLPDGLTDVSKCFFDQPLVASSPHFYSRPGKFLEKLEGIRPNPDKHTSYTIIEPTLGVPLNQRAVSQSNLVTKNMNAFSAEIDKFSNMVIPMFWLEYYLKEVTPVIVGTVEFIVNTLPKIQYWISASLILLGICLLTMGYFRLRYSEANDAKEKK